jgi:hypothetical protein
MNAYVDMMQKKFDGLFVYRHPVKHCESYFPTTDNYFTLLEIKINISSLKTFLKHYSLRTTGNKDDLLRRLFVFLHLSGNSIFIQKNIRGFIRREYNRIHGPAYKKRSLCVNDTDFFTLDSLVNISNDQFFSYKDKDQFIYGFDICSLYNLFMNGKTDVLNPYNRNVISQFYFDRILTILRLSKILKTEVTIDIIEEEIVDKSKALQLRALSIFQKIDSLGNYSDSQWFLSLTRPRLLKFMRELSDIYNYRANLSQDIKYKICPPSGNPFYNFDMQIVETGDLDSAKNSILNVIENFINNGVDNDSKSLGAYYVLASLTLVNSNAAEAIPWLYQSVLYI